MASSFLPYNCIPTLQASMCVCVCIVYMPSMTVYIMCSVSHAFSLASQTIGETPSEEHSEGGGASHVTEEHGSHVTDEHSESSGSHVTEESQSDTAESQVLPNPGYSNKEMVSLYMQYKMHSEFVLSHVASLMIFMATYSVFNANTPLSTACVYC